MKRERTYRGAQKYGVISINGQAMCVPITDDLSNEELQTHFDNAFRKEDYEYCQAITAEAESRGLKLKFE